MRGPPVTAWIMVAMLGSGCPGTEREPPVGDGVGQRPDAGPVLVGGANAQERAHALEVFALVNAQRLDAGVAALAWDDAVAAVAQGQAVDMDVRNFFSHTNPDGQDVAARLADAGLEYSAAGENIAQGQDGPRQVMDAWMLSPGHRANIMSRSYTQVGVGVRHADGGPWWTQVFRRP